MAKILLALALTLTVALLTSPTRGGISINPKVTVNITNLLFDNSELRLQCKSKNDDLGPKVLAPGQSWAFRFRPLFFFDQTLFFCRMEWNGGVGPVYVDVFDRSKVNCHQCCWKIHKEGPCFHFCDDPFGVRCLDWRRPSDDSPEALLFE